MCREEMTNQNLVIRRFNERDFHDLSLLMRDKMSSPYAVYDIQWPTDDDNKLGFSKTRSFETSFANDAQGNPISFLAGAYEYIC